MGTARMATGASTRDATQENDMTRTPNHRYNVPEEGEQNWHVPLNENFERYDVDIEIRDESHAIDEYEPREGAKFLATDTGVVYMGDGTDWEEAFDLGGSGIQSVGSVEPDDDGNLALVSPDGSLSIAPDDTEHAIELSVPAISDLADAIGVPIEQLNGTPPDGDGNLDLVSPDESLSIASNETENMIELSSPAMFDLADAVAETVRQVNSTPPDGAGNLNLVSPDDSLSIAPNETENTIELSVHSQTQLNDDGDLVGVRNVFANDVFENSDARLKQNVSPFENGLETVNALRPVTFEWADDDEGNDRQVGLIAQDVADVLPEIVERRKDDADGEEGHLGVNYSKLVPVLLDAVQRQQAELADRDERIDALETERNRNADRIDTLETRNESLEDRLETLEARVGSATNGTPSDD